MFLSWKTKKVVRIIAAMVFSVFIVSCQHERIRLQKSKLLDATMDPAKTMSPALSIGAEPMLWAEKASLSEGYSAVGSSCPTCGS